MWKLSFNGGSRNRVEMVGSVHLGRPARGRVDSPCKSCNSPTRGPRDPRSRIHQPRLRYHPRNGWPDMESGVVSGRRQACSPLQDEEPESAAVPGPPSAPPQVLADGSRSGQAWTPRPARVPELSPASYTELRSDGSLAPGRVCDGAPTKEKGISRSTLLGDRFVTIGWKIKR